MSMVTSSSRSEALAWKSPARVLAEAIALVLVIVGLGAWIVRNPASEAVAVVDPVVVEAEPPAESAPPELPEEAVPDPEPPPLPDPEPEPIGPDPVALARAEEDLKAVEAALQAAEEEKARLVSEHGETELRTLAATRTAAESAEQLRREAERVAAARANIAALQGERDRLNRVIAAIEAAPPPREALNTSRSPVARTITGEEYHFEIRGDRVAFIDLDRLLEKAQVDAKLRLRMTGLNTRGVSGTVGPIGAFSMSYQIGPTAVGLSADPRRPTAVSASFGLQGFEVVPTRAQRGEPFEIALSPVSEVGRVIQRLDPSRTTITLWVYPDGFALYRRLWNALHEYGFTIAARPLPEGMPIRGGPNGSRSAGQ
ncbi:hypothetical protein [Tautonia marina]|uniref:hypothetical protein n=1 Tax=Tautonia marina TaxID=2653855 RepID=UPI001260D239|nr:hypothetical protein [Tautonia marina]